MKIRELAEKRAILVCNGKKCKAAGAGKLRKALEAAAKSAEEKTAVVKCSCLGRCGRAPVAVVWPEGLCVMEASPEDAVALVSPGRARKKNKRDKSGEKKKKDRKEKEEAAGAAHN